MQRIYPCMVLFALLILLTAVAHGSCDLSATPANFASQLAAAQPGQTICLASGSYGDFHGAAKSSPGVTITGASDSPLPTMRIEFTSGTPAWLILDHIHFTSSTGADGYPGDLDVGHDITFQNSHFGHFLNIDFGTGQGANIVFNNDLFDVSDGLNVNGDEGRLQVKGTSSATSMTIENSKFAAGCADGMQFGGGGTGITVGPNNEFYNLVQGTCGPHVDSIQFNSVPAPGPVIKGNYFHDDSTGIIGYDYANYATITNNVLKNITQDALGGNAGGTISHNTLYNNELSCGITHQGNVCHSAFINNIATDFNNTGGGTGNPSQLDYNLFTQSGCNISQCGTHNLLGTPTYLGGANPTTYNGFALANGSAGKAAASDGSDIGINVNTTNTTNPPTAPTSLTAVVQ